MLISRTTILDVSVERAWAMLQRPQLLDHIAYPLQVFEPVDPPQLPDIWAEGAYKVRCCLLGLIDIGEQWINIEMVETGPNRFKLRDNGRGDLATKWDHMITIAPIAPDRCRYTDAVEVEAGWHTPFVAAFAWVFYRYRQNRWRGLVRSDFSQLTEASRS